MTEQKQYLGNTFVNWRQLKTLKSFLSIMIILSVKYFKAKKLSLLMKQMFLINLC